MVEKTGTLIKLYEHEIGHPKRRHLIDFNLPFKRVKELQEGVPEKLLMQVLFAGMLMDTLNPSLPPDILEHYTRVWQIMEELVLQFDTTTLWMEATFPDDDDGVRLKCRLSEAILGIDLGGPNPLQN